MNAKFKENLFELVKVVIIAIVVNTFVHIFVLMSNKVYSISMQPNFYEGDLLITDKLITWVHDTPLGNTLNYNYQRGDIVVISQPGKDALIKRIIALSNEKIMVKQGAVYINGQVLNEPYLPAGRLTRPGTFLQEGQELTVPEDSVFVMGDNRENSLDSRFYEVGFIRKKSVLGRVQFRILPLDKFGQVN